MPGHILTYTGIYIEFDNFTKDQIHIEDIAHSLAMECRYSGHCNAFYSVAEHCVLLADIVLDKTDAKILLLHDASEAYLSDIIRGLKYTPAFDGYRELEDRVNALVMEKFGLPTQLPEHLKELDDRIVTNELQSLFNELPPVYVNRCLKNPPIPGLHLRQWNWQTAKMMFLNTYRELFTDE